MRFQTDLRPNTPIVVYLELRGAPQSEGNKILAGLEPLQRPRSSYANGRDHRTVQLQPIISTHRLRLRGKTGADGLVQVFFNVTGPIPDRSPDVRKFAVGLKSIGFAKRSDFATRADIVEDLLLES